jgi:threonine dehydrogenase-like Zn-dependent dehydrogenase
VAVELGASRAYPSVNELRAAAADLVIDAVGIEETWIGAVRAVRPGGTVAVIGLGQMTGSVPMGHVVRSGITLRGSYAYSRRDFEQALALLAARPLCREIVTTVALDEGPAAFRLLTEQPERVVKMVLRPARETG